MVTVSILDCSKKYEIESSKTLYDLLNQYMPGARFNFVAAKLNGEILELMTPITSDITIEWVKADSEEGLAIIRHSTSHIMALAVRKLFPDTKIAIGPSTADGFYYDFDSSHRFNEEDFAAIEAEMEKFIKENVPFEKSSISKADALAKFEKENEKYKVELIKDLTDGQITLYKSGDFTDLCRGPHVPNAGYIKAFKIMKIAGAYWRGDEKREMLQRLYGTAFADPKSLKAYLKMLEEALERDHRKIGKEMNLFGFYPEGPGFPFWKPNGMILYNRVLDYWKQVHKDAGYVEVKTPIILNEELWHRSGHWDHYQENMYFTEIDKEKYAIKPMNCPGALEIFKSRQRSYKDLPLRLAEFGHDVRNEPSGTLHGCMRVRGFVQDDAHILCTEDQIGPEVAKFCKLLKVVYHDFGFDDLVVKFSTMPEDHVGDLATWERAEKALADACHEAGLDYEIQPGEGAFYGPKLEFKLYDCLGREWQCGTIQADFQLPSAERLDATYIGADNQKHHPVMLHRAILGSFERFLGILIENFAGAFPTWLAFEQVAVVPVSEEFDDYAKQVNDALVAHDIRSNVYLGDENMKAKIKNISTEHRTPYILVVGEKEKAEGTVCCRYRFSSTKPVETFKLDDFIAYVEDKINSHFIGI